MQSRNVNRELGGLKYSHLSDRVSGEGADAWAVHARACERAEAGEDIIILSIGQEMDERTPAQIVGGAVQSLEQGRHHYTDVEGERSLREAIARAHLARTGQAVDPDQCTVYAGAQNALFAVSLCLLEAGDEVVLCEPYYTTYPATFGAGGAALVRVAVSREQGFAPDPDAIGAAFTDRTRALVLNFPNNPTGAVCTRERMEAIVEACADRGIWIISDEVYADLVPDGANCSPASVARAGDLCVTVSSLSKSHRMTGWRLGWAIGPPELARRLSALSLCMAYGLSPFIQDAAVVALSMVPSPAEAIRATLDAKRRVVADGLRNLPGVKVHDAPGGMFVLLDVSGLGTSAHDFASGLLDAHAVAVLPCDAFGRSTTGLIRISACESVARLATACARIGEYVGSLNK